MVGVAGKTLGPDAELAGVYGLTRRPRGVTDLEWRVGLWVNRSRVEAQQVNRMALASQLASGTLGTQSRIALAVAMGDDPGRAAMSVAVAEANEALQRRAAELARGG